MTSTRESNPAGFSVAVGDAIQARDGKEIGHVSELKGEHFKVDAPMARDYWLSKEVVASVADNVVCLDFATDQLDGFKLDGPVDASAGWPTLDEQTDTFQDTAEQHERRHEQVQG